MSIDVTFKPTGSTYAVSTAAVQPGGSAMAAGGAATTYRIRCTATGYLAWGPTNAVTAGAPAATGTPNTIGMTIGAVEKLEIPSGSFFISSVATGFEVTPGSGGN